MLFRSTSAADRGEYARTLGLDDPLAQQYWSWLSSALRGDLGDSYFLARPVLEVIAARIGLTVSVALAGIVAAIVIGVSLGIASALRPGGLLDRVVSFVVAVLIAVPAFWLGLMLVVLFAVQVRWFPVIGYTPLLENPAAWAWGLVLPGIALGAHGAAVIARQTREAMVESLAAQYVTALRSRGVPARRILSRYAVKNAMVPIIAIIGIELPVILGGTLVIEQVFGMAGLGSSLIQGVLKGDRPLLLGGVLVYVALALLLNLLVDIGYGLVDPRVRLS